MAEYQIEFYAYTVVTFLLLAAEKVFHAYRETGALGTAITEGWEARDRNLVLAKVLCVGLSFLGYQLFVGADRRLGKGTRWWTLWGTSRARSRLRCPMLAALTGLGVAQSP